ncbi:MAG: hypothetical protein ABIR32_09830, partial [Ilumatobacteraceae bacterium]
MTADGQLPIEVGSHIDARGTARSNPLASRRCAVCDCRHAAATTWLRAGMPLAETARRLGHSVETLISAYVGALDDEQHIANQRLDTYLTHARPPTSIHLGL